MSTTQRLILLVVVVGVVFAITLAVSHRNANLPVHQLPSGLAVFQILSGSQALDLHEIQPTNTWQNPRWLIPQGVRTGELPVLATQHRQSVRRVKLTLEAQTEFQLEFRPRKVAGSSDYEDEGAAPTVVRAFKPGEPVEVTILKHGGSFVASNKFGIKPATIVLQPTEGKQ